VRNASGEHIPISAGGSTQHVFYHVLWGGPGYRRTTVNLNYGTLKQAFLVPFLETVIRDLRGVGHGILDPAIVGKIEYDFHKMFPDARQNGKYTVAGSSFIEVYASTAKHRGIGMFLAFLLPAALRPLVMNGDPVTDYLLSQVVTEHRLTLTELLG
jgi:hypothetical protein